jgi:hypothetical protein
MPCVIHHRHNPSETGFNQVLEKLTVKSSTVQYSTAVTQKSLPHDRLMKAEIIVEVIFTSIISDNIEHRQSTCRTRNYTFKTSTQD